MVNNVLLFSRAVVTGLDVEVDLDGVVGCICFAVVALLNR